MPMRALIDLPEIEYLDGEAYPKVSPKLNHMVVQGAMVRILYAAAGKRGKVGPELHVYPGETETDATFVPDVAFISNERLRALDAGDRQDPPFSPDVAVEVRSPSNDLRYLEKKIARYLATGALVVLDVDPQTRTIVAHGASGVRTFAETESFESTDVEWLRFDVAEAFADLDD
jgi:Uma2 family endonuclease